MRCSSAIILISTSSLIVLCYRSLSTGVFKSRKVFTEDEYSSLLDLNTFHFKINTYPCKGYDDGPLLVIIISSDPRNVEKRKAIRQTWGQSCDTTKVLFLFGKSDNSKIMHIVKSESNTFHDVVQGNFVDSYRNMTYKHLMGLKWVIHHCSNAKYILKTDDDLFVNVAALRNFLVDKLSSHHSRNHIVCEVLSNIAVIRNVFSKWMVTMEEYPEERYPQYCSANRRSCVSEWRLNAPVGVCDDDTGQQLSEGPQLGPQHNVVFTNEEFYCRDGFAILYTRDVVPRLVMESQNSPFFWVDDVYITGILADKLRIPLEPFGSMVLSPRRANLLISIGPSYAGEFFFGPPDISAAGIVEFWKAVYHVK